MVYSINFFSVNNSDNDDDDDEIDRVKDNNSRYLDI